MCSSTTYRWIHCLFPHIYLNYSVMESDYCNN